MHTTTNAATALAAGLAVFLASPAAHAQSITVVPVSLSLPAGKQTTNLSIINHAAGETSVQVRVMAWSQADGQEKLVSTDDVSASPPIATIPAGGTQVVRLVLRKPASGHEATYRVLLDQIPAPADPGTVRIALRLSIPVFAQPATRALPHIRYHVDQSDGRHWLVGTNDGSRHETTRNLVLTSSGGTALKLGGNASPYILSGATQRWPISVPQGQLTTGQKLQLTGSSDVGAINSTVLVTGTP